MRLHGVIQRRARAEPPGGDAHRRLVLPPFGFEDGLHAIALLSRLKIELLRADLVVERRETDIVPIAALHDHERRRQPPGGVAAEQIAARERVPEEHLVIPRVERLAPRRDLPARHAADHRRDALDRLAHLRGHVPLDRVLTLPKAHRDPAGRRLLAARPHQPGARDIHSGGRPLRGQLPRIEPVRVFAREHEKAEPVPLELDGRLREVEAELHEPAAATGDEHLARGRERQDRLGSGRRRERVQAGPDERAGTSRAHDGQPVTAGEKIVPALRHVILLRRP